MVFKPEHRSTVKERGELDILVRENTWLFGEHFHITLPEIGLTRIIERVAEEISSTKNRRRKVTKPDGKSGRADCFLGRVIPHPEQERREYLIVELKRPSIKIGRKELDQLEDYVTALRTQPDFKHTSTTWSFYLVTGEYDDAIRDRITQKDRPAGLFLEKDNYRVWVKAWSEIIRDIAAIKNSMASPDPRNVVKVPPRAQGTEVAAAP
jgi:hypothetical protein